MRVDFYQLTRDPATKLVPVLAQKVLDAGDRLLVVAGEAEVRAALSDALWNHRPESFLANAEAGGEAEADQPILLSDACKAANGAAMCLIADGQWRDEALCFDRIFYLFLPDHAPAAREAWRQLARHEAAEPHYWRQDGGRWVEGP